MRVQGGARRVPGGCGLGAKGCREVTDNAVTRGVLRPLKGAFQEKYIPRAKTMQTLRLYTNVCKVQYGAWRVPGG